MNTISRAFLSLNGSVFIPFDRCGWHHALIHGAFRLSTHIGFFFFNVVINVTSGVIELKFNIGKINYNFCVALFLVRLLGTFFEI